MRTYVYKQCILILSPWQAVGLDGRVQKILTWRWKEVSVEMGRQAVTCSQVPEGEDDVSVGSLQCAVYSAYSYTKVGRKDHAMIHKV